MSNSGDQMQPIDSSATQQTQSRGFHSSEQARPLNNVARIGGIYERGGDPSVTATVTVSNEQNNAAESPEILPLTLRGRPNVTWDDSVIDNEGMGRKSSKRCCIFHKQRAFDESSTDTSDYDSDGSLSSASGGEGGNDRSGKQLPRKIARPKQGAKIPDYQRFHA